MKTQELLEAARKQLTDASALADTVAQEDRDYSPEEKAKIDGHFAEAKRLKEEAEGSRNRDELSRQMKELETAVFGSEETVITEDSIKGVRSEHKAKERRTWGEAFTGSEEYQGAIKSLGGREASQNSRIHIGPVDTKAIFTGGSATQGAPLINPDQQGLVDEGPLKRPLALRDLITVGRTSSDAVRYARVTGFTNAATGVHEASTATGTNAAGGLKPQSDVATQTATANVVTIAHWFAVTKQALADAPYVRTLIDSFGRYGLQEEEEDQIIAGTGAANDQLVGFNTVSGMQTQAFDTDIFKTVRKAKTLIRKIGRATATGVLMNLEDEETIDLYRLNQGGGAGTGSWVGNGPFRTGPNTLWGLPIVSTDAVPASKCYVADFRTIVLLVRQDAQMTMTDSHADYFVRNLVAMLFEERATSLVMRPKAIVECATV